MWVTWFWVKLDCENNTVLLGAARLVFVSRHRLRWGGGGGGGRYPAGGRFNYTTLGQVKQVELRSLNPKIGVVFTCSGGGFRTFVVRDRELALAI